MEFFNVRSQKAFATASIITGILSLITMCMILPSIALGGLSILFAILSTRKGQTMFGNAIAGLITGCIGLVSSVAILAASFAMIPSLMEDPAYRDYLNDLSMQMYGETFDEMTGGMFDEAIHFD